MKKSYHAITGAECTEEVKLTSRQWFVIESYTYVLKTEESKIKIKL